MASIFDKVKSHFDNFLPVWEWKIHSVDKKEVKRTYKQINAICKISQYVLAGAAILFAVSFERSRQMLASSVFRKGLPTFLADIAIYLILAYVLGLKRFPVNYISFVIVRTCIVLEEIVKPDRNNYKVSQHTVGKSRLHSFWTVITVAPRTTPPVVPASTLGPSYTQITGIVLLFIIGYWMVTRFTKIYVSKYKEAVLIAQIISTSVAAILVLTPYSFDVLPNEFKEIHRKYSKRWVIFTVGVTIFTVAFLLERLQLTVTHGKGRSPFNFIDWEAFITLVVFSLMVRHLPRIHKELSISEIFANKEEILLEAVLPTSVMNAWVTFSTDNYGIKEAIRNLYAGYFTGTEPHEFVFSMNF